MTTPTTTASTADRIPGGRILVRPEIQALRAFAVLAVVIYHLWPGQLTGGYVGVDVFFVISGFLIVGHLVREVNRTGRLSLSEFWGRRARRLLPASLVVIAITALTTALVVPEVFWAQWFREFGAAATYVQNWVLAGDSVDYLGADNKPSPVQHFWSLSVEEQFYIAWPLVIVIVIWIASRVRAASPMRSIASTLAVVTAASFAYSVWSVVHTPAPAYFVTQGRAWEFGLGGLLALLQPAVSRALPRVRSAAAWLGVIALAVVVATYDASTPFPGASALAPVGATMLVIWAGSPEAGWAPTRLFALRPVQWLGDVSYSLYLWHWAPIVILPIVLGRDLDPIDRVAILIGSGVLAALSKRFVEDPVRARGPLASRAGWISVVSAVAASALVLGACVAVTTDAHAKVATAAAHADDAIRNSSQCVGENAVLPGSGCAAPYAVTSLTDPTFARADIGKGVQNVDPCKQALDAAPLITCTIGDTATPTTTLALLGDSHAGHFLEPLDIYGKAHHIRFITMLKSWCAGTGTGGLYADAFTIASQQSCEQWGTSALDRVATDPTIDGVVFSNYTKGYMVPTGPQTRIMKPDDYLSAWRPLIAAGKSIVVIRDTPRPTSFVPDCVAQNMGVYDPCATPKSVAVLPAGQDPQLIAASEAKSVKVVDLDDAFCDATNCHSVIGGLIVYFDGHHMTATFARTLAATVGGRIAKALHLAV